MLCKFSICKRRFESNTPINPLKISQKMFAKSPKDAMNQKCAPQRSGSFVFVEMGAVLEPGRRIRDIKPLHLKFSSHFVFVLFSFHWKQFSLFRWSFCWCMLEGVGNMCAWVGVPPYSLDWPQIWNYPSASASPRTESTGVCHHTQLLVDFKLCIFLNSMASPMKLNKAWLCSPKSKSVSSVEGKRPTSTAWRWAWGIRSAL